LSEFIFCNKCGGQNEKESEHCSTCGEEIKPIESEISNKTDDSNQQRKFSVSNWGIVFVGSILVIPLAIVFAYNWLYPLYICLVANVVILIIAIYTFRKTTREKSHYFFLIISIISIIVTLTFVILTIVFGGELRFVPGF